MSLATHPLSDTVSVAAQLGPEAMAEAQAAGFRSVINNRPDFEGGPAQPTSVSIEAAARAAGLAYAWLPVAPAIQTEAEIARFASLLASLPPPVLAFCRSGARSTKLCNAAALLGRAAGGEPTARANPDTSSDPAKP